MNTFGSTLKGSLDPHPKVDSRLITLMSATGTMQAEAERRIKRAWSVGVLHRHAKGQGSVMEINQENQMPKHSLPS